MARSEFDQKNPLPWKKGVSDTLAEFDSTNPRGIWGTKDGGGMRKMEETFGGRKKQSTKDAENRQYEAGENAYRETGGVLDTLKQADTDYYKGSAAAADTYKGSRNKTYDDYIGAENRSTSDYRGRRDDVIKKQLAGDAAATEAYQRARNPVYEKYQGQLQQYSDEAANQASDATKTYKNNIQPRLQDIMDNAQRDANSAMSLADAGNPNNSVNTAWRNMYEQQAQGVNKRALADVGVLNALGAQATANQLGAMGGPLSTQQMLALQGQNMGQSGQAFARAQQQMQALRDQGLAVGREESAAQYNRGERARDRYSGSVRDYAGADSDYQDRMGKYRSERAGYGDRGFEIGRQKAGEDYQIDQGRVGLEADLGRGAASEDYGIDQRLNQQGLDIGKQRNQEDWAIGSGLSGLQHQLAGDQAGRDISNINQRYGRQGQLAQNQAGVGYQQQIMGPQILAGLGGAGVKAAAAAGGGGAPGGAEQGATASQLAGDYEQDEDFVGPPRRAQSWGRY
jgi:hypothetical protein